MQQGYDGGDLRLGEVLETADTYTRYAVTYRSAGLTISGILNLPDGAGPFPVLVLAHGYIDPDVYTTGRGLRREQDYLARQGYAVLHTDYRNHAGSSDDPENEVRLRLGYTEDVVNAVLAVRAATDTIPQLDGERVGLLGRSMGGGVALNTLVVQPGLVDAAVVYASVSSNAVQNFDQWTRGQPGSEALTDQIIGAYGAPEANPEFWQGVSPVTFFDRVTEPVLIHHGTADETCPPQWALDTDAALRVAGKDVTLQLYEGEPHAFEGDWQLSIERSAAFFAQHLSAG
nr:alpha/beta fold hydrolase [Jiangella mangrovi]